MSGKSVADATERLRLHGARGARGVVVGHSLPACLSAISLTPCEVRTPFGRVQLHRGIAGGAPLYVLYRHGRDTSSLAHELNYRANCWALRSVGVSVLLLLSSVGLVSDALPLNEPLMIDDLLMLESKLPDGSPCTYGEGYLIAQGTLFSPSLREQFGREWARTHGGQTVREVSYAFVPGPRTKSPLENRALRAMGVETNSMTIGPEVVLANELGVATFAVGIGHVSTQPARSFGTSAPDGDNGIVERSLKAVDFSAVVECFLAACDPDTRPAAFVHTRPARSAATRRGLGEGAVWLCSGALVAAGVAAAVLALGALVRRRT